MPFAYCDPVSPKNVPGTGVPVESTLPMKRSSLPPGARALSPRRERVGRVACEDDVPVRVGRGATNSSPAPPNAFSANRRAVRLQLREEEVPSALGARDRARVEEEVALVGAGDEDVAVAVGRDGGRGADRGPIGRRKVGDPTRISRRIEAGDEAVGLALDEGRIGEDEHGIVNCPAK